MQCQERHRAEILEVGEPLALQVDQHLVGLIIDAFPLCLDRVVGEAPLRTCRSVEADDHGKNARVLSLGRQLAPVGPTGLAGVEGGGGLLAYCPRVTHGRQ